MGLKMFTLEIRVTILENTKLVFVSGPKKKKREKNLLKLVICWCESIVTDQRWESCESVESAILLSLQIFNHSKETTQRIRRSSTRGTHEGRRILLYPFCLAGWCESIVTIHVCWGWSLLVFFFFFFFSFLGFSIIVNEGNCHCWLWVTMERGFLGFFFCNYFCYC